MPSQDPIQTSFIFDKYSVSKEIMSAPEGTSYAAPESVVMRNVDTLNHWLEVWGLNMIANAPMIMADYGFSIHTKKPSKLAGTENAFPSYPPARPDLAIIVGSGPSLDDYLPLMRSWPGFVIASATNATALMAHGVVPHYVLAVDASPELAIYLENIAQTPGASSINLLLPITVDPEAASAWPYRRFWHLDFIQAGKGLNNPFNSFQCLLFPFVQHYVVQAGNVVNCASMLPMLWGSVGLFDIKKVFLFGVDGGPLGNRSRVRRYKYDPTDFTFSVFDPPSISAMRSSPEKMSANGILTEEGQLGYKRSLLTVWWATFYRDGVGDANSASRRPGMYHLYSCSKGILEDSLPHVDGKKVLATNGECARLYNRAFVDSSYKRYMNDIAPQEGQQDALQDAAERQEANKKADEQSAQAATTQTAFAGVASKVSTP